MSVTRFLGVWPRVVTSARAAGDIVAERVDQPLHEVPAGGFVGFAVGDDHLLVDPPGRFDVHVFVCCEQAGQPFVLLSVSRSAPVCSARRAA
jgi:hypothetical protein